ncbi:hypothetical protein GCM10010123_42970 [Pilimelia anulata]|uniref:Uncharacterized protein n=1 Tax=Pilimelia anulata TaxID=53371 RepID=A0A8J3BAV9_9ACTN|nr:hypothetical protein GCM10010123_42970 [Pilimelia anulata]
MPERFRGGIAPSAPDRRPGWLADRDADSPARGTRLPHTVPAPPPDIDLLTGGCAEGYAGAPDRPLFGVVVLTLRYRPTVEGGVIGASLSHPTNPTA